MKRMITLFLVLIMALSLAACGNSVKNLNDISKMIYAPSKYESVMIKFTGNNQFTIEIWEYTDDPSTPSGVSAMANGNKPVYEETVNYTLDGDNFITVDQKYYYDIDTERSKVVFTGDFLGIGKEWTMYE